MIYDLPMSIFYSRTFYIVLSSNTEKHPDWVIMNSFYDDVLKEIEFIVSSSNAGRIKFMPFFHYYLSF